MVLKLVWENVASGRCARCRRLLLIGLQVTLILALVTLTRDSSGRKTTRCGRRPVFLTRAARF